MTEFKPRKKSKLEKSKLGNMMETPETTMFEFCCEMSGKENPCDFCWLYPCEYRWGADGEIRLPLMKRHDYT